MEYEYTHVKKLGGSQVPGKGRDLRFPGWAGIPGSRVGRVHFGAQQDNDLVNVTNNFNY